MSLVARELEASGIATVCLSLVKEVTLRVRPPRALYLKFPFGHPLGEPGRIYQQAHILELALQMFADSQPGELRSPPLRWRVSRYPGEQET